MPFQLTPTQARLRAARDFQADFSNTTYYLFAASPTVEEGTWPSVPEDDQRALDETWRKMVFGKRIDSSNVVIGVRRIDYTLGASYASYLDSDPELHDKDYYAIVNAGAYYHCWKVLDNNANGVSNVAPDIADIDPSGAGHRTSDGYLWKYLYTVSNTDARKWATSTVFPVVANSQTNAIAVDGSIDVVQVLSGGQAYENYANGTFSAADVRVGGNSFIYAITSNSGASSVDDFYTGCVLYISSGSGMGQWAEVVDYFSNSSGKFCTINAAFATPPTNGSGWELNPMVRFSNAAYTNAASARALINASGNSVYRIEVLSRGSGYEAATATVLAANVVGATAANVRVVMGPPGGHGSSPESELGARYCVLSCDLATSESNTVPTDGYYQRTGVLRSPLFDGVQLTIAENGTAFIPGEVARLVTLRKLGTVSATIDSPNVTGTSVDLTVRSGDSLLIENAANTSRQLVTVNSVVNSTLFTTTSNLTFSDASSTLYLSTCSGNGVVRVSNAHTVTLDGWRGNVVANSIIVGATGGARGTVNSVARGGVTKGFDTFVQALRLDATVTSGAFTSGELVLQGSSAGGFYHSSDATYVLLTEWFGSIGAGTIVGQSSGAVADVTAVETQELRYRSGEVVFLEYSDRVNRDPIQTERFTVTFEF